MTMKTFAALVSLVMPLALAGAQAAALPAVSTTESTRQMTQAEKKISGSPTPSLSASGSAQARHLFPVRD